MEFATEHRLVQLAVNAMRREGVAVTPKAVERVIVDVERTQQVRLTEVEREVVRHGVYAVMDDASESGAVRVFAPPAGPGDYDRGAAALSPARRAQLEEELSWAITIRDDKASSPGRRAMAEEDIKKLQRLLALPDRPQGTSASSAAHASRPSALNAGTDRFVAPEPYWPARNAATARDDEGGAAQPSTEDELAELKDEMTSLLKVLNDPATAPDDRAHAQARLDQVRQEIMDRGRHVPLSKTT
jgi:hypothetical protein